MVHDVSEPRGYLAAALGNAGRDLLDYPLGVIEIGFNAGDGWDRHGAHRHAGFVEPAEPIDDLLWEVGWGCGPVQLIRVSGSNHLSSAYFCVARKAITSARSLSSGTAITIRVPGTTVKGDLRNLSSTGLVHVSPESFSAGE